MLRTNCPPPSFPLNTPSNFAQCLKVNTAWGGAEKTFSTSQGKPPGKAEVNTSCERAKEAASSDSFSTANSN